MEKTSKISASENEKFSKLRLACSSTLSARTRRLAGYLI